MEQRIQRHSGPLKVGHVGMTVEMSSISGILQAASAKLFFLRVLTSQYYKNERKDKLILGEFSDTAEGKIIPHVQCYLKQRVPMKKVVTAQCPASLDLSSFPLIGIIIQISYYSRTDDD